MAGRKFLDGVIVIATIMTSGPENSQTLESECHLWQFRKNDAGYGQVRHKGKVERAHRVVFCAANGCEIEDIKGLCILHKCDNPSCVNPSHLKLGTVQDNMQDKMLKGRHVQVRGEDQGSSKLTVENIKYIKSVFIKSHRKFGASALAREFRVHSSTINRIVNNKSWAHIGSSDLDKEGEGRALLN